MMRALACAMATCWMLSGSLAGHQSPTYTLRFVPKENQELKYKLVGTLETPIGVAALASTISYRIVRIAGDGNYTLQATTEEALVKVGEQEIRSPAPVTFFTYRPSGEVVEITGLDPTAERGQTSPENYRMTNLTRFYPPENAIAVGAKWERELKPDGKTVSVGVRASFVAEAVEKLGEIEVVRVKATAREEGVGNTAQVEGTFWISTLDGVEWKSESKWTSVMVPGAPTPTSGTLTRTLVPATKA